ncbi:16S rRNA (cytidine(1402)-2'-O)-methyltransferase [Nodosilinea sp. PGN35]|uniref:16S rRNA (cytidine(1402)-2'-O)-methyltransferase n=1 Tax=Nodosilinea sp. PGN35 TaxID=3020489 RepID=UPI0023B2A0F9|nr:16S rRNA (cytidine(1402)-2'-O)-methyltransferase [Nodosilinea sp. TSF1-S3]MDF0368898.1 16S rRNA (cytidine(1402)-2'-O)-methyltransferase [Nodosilinea sp. TSF1-S3]
MPPAPDTDPKPGHLYVVGTPLGNLEDMTFRAVRILQSVDLIAAEDTRHTGKLLAHFQIATPQISYHEHNRHSRIGEVLHHLQARQHAVALVSDAGMPGISDPGYELVVACVEAKIPVIPIPGPTAAMTALCVAGLPSDRFIFEGFLPLKGKERTARLEAIAQEDRTIILYEAPHKLLKTLEDLVAVLGGDRPVTLGRELTKRFEEFWRGTLGEALTHYQREAPKGEFTVVIQGATRAAPVLSEDALRAELEQLLRQGMSRADASRHLAKATGQPKKTIYQLSLGVDPEGLTS